MNLQDSYLCLAYSSRLVRSLSETEMNGLTTIADRNNKSRNLTGVLLRFGDHIIQYLEGPHFHLAPLFHTICQDKRHGNIRVVYMGTTMQRLFKSWNCLYRQVEADTADAPGELERQIRSIFSTETELSDTLLRLAREIARP